MSASSESKPERPEELPKFPTVEEMKTWDRKRVLKWIQQIDSNILEDDDVDNFKKARIAGRAFLDSDVDFYYKTCGLPPGVSLALKKLADEVKEGGKFIPWT
jgi:hypothetical protein